MNQRSPVPAPVAAVCAGDLTRAVADLAAELDELENHEGHDVQAILARASAAAEVADRCGDAVLGHRRDYDRLGLD